jgi:hypothetical protein
MENRLSPMPFFHLSFALLYLLLRQSRSRPEASRITFIVQTTSPARQFYTDDIEAVWTLIPSL